MANVELSEDTGTGTAAVATIDLLIAVAVAVDPGRSGHPQALRGPGGRISLISGLRTVVAFPGVSGGPGERVRKLIQIRRLRSAAYSFPTVYASSGLPIKNSLARRGEYLSSDLLLYGEGRV